MAARKLVTLFLFLGLFLVGGTSVVRASSGVVIEEMRFQKVEGGPAIKAIIYNSEDRFVRTEASLTIMDILAGKEVEVYRGDLMVMAPGEKKEVEFDWKEEWQGFGMARARLELGYDGEEVVAEKNLGLVVPPFTAGLGLVSLLALGGAGGRLLFLRLV